jgi:hypothetical protein
MTGSAWGPSGIVTLSTVAPAGPALGNGVFLHAGYWKQVTFSEQFMDKKCDCGPPFYFTHPIVFLPGIKVFYGPQKTDLASRAFSI